MNMLTTVIVASFLYVATAPWHVAGRPIVGSVDPEALAPTSAPALGALRRRRPSVFTFDAEGDYYEDNAAAATDVESAEARLRRRFKALAENRLSPKAALFYL